MPRFRDRVLDALVLAAGVSTALFMLVGVAAAVVGAGARSVGALVPGFLVLVPVLGAVVFVLDWVLRGRLFDPGHN